MQYDDPECGICMQGWEYFQEVDRLILGNIPIWEVSKLMVVPIAAIERHISHKGNLTDQDRMIHQLDVNLSEAIGLQNRAKHQMPGCKMQMAAMREIRAIIELKARILGEIKNQKVVTIVEHPEWQRLRYAIMNSLERYPEAKRAVVEELSAMRALPCPTN